MKKSQKGFTIIEVALVLAVGALIFLVVFLAVPALQRNQRNDARKRDQAQVIEAITSYIANNPASSVAQKGDVNAYEDGHVAYKNNNGVGQNFGKYIDTLSNNTESIEIAALKSGSSTAEGLPTNLNPTDANEKQKLRKTMYVVPQTVCDDSHKKPVPGSTRQASVIIFNETTKGFDQLCASAN